MVFHEFSWFALWRHKRRPTSFSRFGYGLLMTCSIFLSRSFGPSLLQPLPPYPKLILLNVKNVQLYHIAVQLKPKTEKTDKPTDSTRIEIKIIHLSSSQPPIKPETKTLIYAIILIRFKPLSNVFQWRNHYVIPTMTWYRDFTYLLRNTYTNHNQYYVTAFT